MIGIFLPIVDALDHVAARLELDAAERTVVATVATRVTRPGLVRVVGGLGKDGGRGYRGGKRNALKEGSNLRLFKDKSAVLHFENSVLKEWHCLKKTYLAAVLASLA